MLESTVWRQYHDENNFRELLSPLCNIDVIDMIEDDKDLYNVIKAKLTKKELKLLAMDLASLGEAALKEAFSYDDEELQKAKFKLYKKLKQDKFRLGLKASSLDYEV